MPNTPLLSADPALVELPEGVLPRSEALLVRDNSLPSISRSSVELLFPVLRCYASTVGGDRWPVYQTARPNWGSGAPSNTPSRAPECWPRIKDPGQPWKWGVIACSNPAPSVSPRGSRKLNRCCSASSPRPRG